MPAGTIRTDRPDLTLRLLADSDCESLLRLLAENRAHLTAHGDYLEQVSMSGDALRADLAANDKLRFGIFVRDELVGRIDLVPVDPPRYGLGYWLARHATGSGHATLALRALLDHARDQLRACDIFAGVTHGNAPSEALLRRTGFVPVARFDTYNRFHRNLRTTSSIQD
jgi:RimJ/RimL family protein N-acetyltransferase